MSSFYGPLRRHSKRRGKKQPPTIASASDGARAEGFDDPAMYNTWYDKTLEDFQNHGRHWHIARFLGEPDFKDYWARIMPDPPARDVLVSEDTFNMMYEEITPTFDKDGSLIRVRRLCGWEGLNSRDSPPPEFFFSFHLPNEQDLASGDWQNQVISMGEYGGGKSIKIGDMEDSDVRDIAAIAARSVVMWAGSCPSSAAYIWKAAGEGS
ncbi:MAG: hypothetical protein Q9218_007689, partial [Villophora microphyllina]